MDLHTYIIFLLPKKHSGMHIHANCMHIHANLGAYANIFLCLLHLSNLLDLIIPICCHYLVIWGIFSFSCSTFLSQGSDALLKKSWSSFTFLRFFLWPRVLWQSLRWCIISKYQFHFCWHDIEGDSGEREDVCVFMRERKRGRERNHLLLTLGTGTYSRMKGCSRSSLALALFKGSGSKHLSTKWAMKLVCGVQWGFEQTFIKNKRKAYVHQNGNDQGLHWC